MLQETRHTTGADGTYAFTIPPDQVASPYLYIELDVEHPDYATRDRFGYALSMTRKNEKLNERPFFETDRDAPGQADHRAGRDARGRARGRGRGAGVLAHRQGRGQFEYGSFARAKTDAQGRFRLPITTPGQAAYWVLPKDYAPELYVVPDGKRGDIGTITLKKGVSVTGRVLDVQGKPMAGVFVEIERQRGTGPDLEAQNLDVRLRRDPPDGGDRRRRAVHLRPVAPGGIQRHAQRDQLRWRPEDPLDPPAIARGLRPHEADDQGGRDPRPAGDPRLALGRDRGALGR